VQETQEERSLRTRVFVQGAFRWYVSIVGFIVFFVIGCIAIPHIFSPVKVSLHCASPASASLGLDTGSALHMSGRVHDRDNARQLHLVARLELSGHRPAGHDLSARLKTASVCPRIPCVCSCLELVAST